MLFFLQSQAQQKPYFPAWKGLLSQCERLSEYRPGYNVPPSSEVTYACPACGTLLEWQPGERWYCPNHGFISKWKYRFKKKQKPVQPMYQPTTQQTYAAPARPPPIQAAVQRVFQSNYPEQAPATPTQSYFCPYCKQPLAYAPNLQRWYCRYCQRPI